MPQTRPRLEQLDFKSSKTGTHNIDTYLEAAEIGNRTLAQLMGDLFDANGNFAPETILPEFRIDQTGGQTSLQYRTDNSNPWEDLVGFFNDRGTYANGTAYNTLDLVTVSDGTTIDLYVVKANTSAFTSQTDFVNSVSTQLITTNTAGILQDVRDARDDVLDDAGFIAVSTDIQATPSKIQTVSDNLGTGLPVTVVAADLNLTNSNIEAVSGAIANVNNVGNNITAVTNVSAQVGTGLDVTVVADDLDLGATSKITQTADNIANVNAVGTDLLDPNSALTTVADDLNATPSQIAQFLGGLNATIHDLTIEGVAQGAIDSASTTSFDMTSANNFVFDRANGGTLTLTNSHLCSNMQPFTIVIKEDGTNTSLQIDPVGQIKWPGGAAPTLTGTSNNRLVISGFVLDPDPNNSTSAEIIAGYVGVS